VSVQFLCDTDAPLQKRHQFDYTEKVFGDALLKFYKQILPICSNSITGAKSSEVFQQQNYIANFLNEIGKPKLDFLPFLSRHLLRVRK
jgi:hypothetical protein